MSAFTRLASTSLAFAQQVLPRFGAKGMRFSPRCRRRECTSLYSSKPRMSGAAQLEGAPGAVGPELSPLTAEELEQERNAPAPFPKADVKAMSPQEREALRVRSRSIPLVVSHAPLDVVFEDDTFLVVSKPSWLKMHPVHRFQGAFVRPCKLACWRASFTCVMLLPSGLCE